MNNADGVGGIARTVGRLASALAERHSVELISLYRRREHPAYPHDPRVKVTYLLDARAGKAKGDPRRRIPTRGPQVLRRLDKHPTRLAPRLNEPLMSTLTDWLLVREIRSLKPGVLVSTRPAMSAAAARFAPRHVLTVGQDHLNFEGRSNHPDLLRLILDSVPRLDGFALLTEADARQYRQHLEGSGAAVVAIPNPLPWSLDEPAPLTAKTVVSVGRLVERKGFERLIRAYAPVARAHPAWRLHIYGEGEQRAALSELITAFQLDEHVQLKGYSDQIEDVLTHASIFAMGSTSEGFPMALLEGMSKGLPLISFDCPRGPAEMIRDGHNGRLVPDGDISGFSAALQQLIEDDEARRQMGGAAFVGARQYEIQAIVSRWETLFKELLARRLGGGSEA